jgi:hypothetical protein
MGYSLGIDVRNDRLAKKMLKFMGKNYRKWSTVLGSGPESVSTRELTDDISYGQRKGVIGFDYASHCHGWEQTFLFCLARWVALKVGRTKRKFEMEESSGKVFTFDEPVHYITYDGVENWPIIVVSDARAAMKVGRDRRWCCCDEYGVYINARVNSILAMRAESLILDPKVSKAFLSEHAKLKVIPGDSGSRRRAEALRAKHAKPEIDRMLPMVRNEIVRLDGLWNS